MFVITLFALPPACVKVAKRITTSFRVEPLLEIVVVWLGRTGYALGRYGASGGCVFFCPLRRGGGSATPVDVRCANNHIDTDTTKLACASNRVSVEDTKELFTGLGAVFVPQ